MLPHRVYALEKGSNWYYTLTDEKGELSEPLEVLRATSVLPGHYFGGGNEQRYLFNENKTWSVSNEAELHYCWVFSEKPFIKTTAFRPVDSKIVPAPSIVKQLPLRFPLSQPKQGKSKTSVLIYDPFKTQWVETPEQRKWEPSRVHYIFVPEKNTWAFVVTNTKKKLSQPKEILLPGSTLSGAYFKVVSDNFFYLTPAQTWVPVDHWEQHHYLVLSEPPIVKVVSFTPPEPK